MTYEELCYDPTKSIQMVADASSALGYPLSLLDTPLPIKAKS